MIQLLNCHSAEIIQENGTVTVLSKFISCNTKRSSYYIVKMHFLYYKTVQLLYCHSAVPILLDVPVTV